MRAILVPVKSFRAAKHRLADALDDATRQRLARDLATIVVRARGASTSFVACDDGEVADWACATGATVLWTPGLGLSGAVDAGFDYLVGQGYSLITVAHADLPFVTDLSTFGSTDRVTIAPDHRLDGTNVIAVPASTSFTFAYGPGSYLRHRDKARAQALECRTVFDWRLASDIDLPRDLDLVRHLLESESDQ